MIFFWVWRLHSGNAQGPKVFWLRRMNSMFSEHPRRIPPRVGDLTGNLTERFTPWQVIVSVLTLVYAGRHLDSMFGLGCESCVPIRWHTIDIAPHTAPEPLARLVTTSRLTANTHLDV